MKSYTKNPAYYMRLKRGLNIPRWIPQEIAYPIAKKEERYEELIPLVSFREGQEDIIKKALSKKVAMVVAPTGFGKSIMAAHLIDKDKQTIIACHSLDLIKGFQDTLKNLNIETCVYGGGKKDTDKRVILVHHRTLGTEYKEVFSKLDIGTVIIDECHMFFSELQQKVLEDLFNKEKNVYAFTATPNREDYDSLRDSPILDNVYSTRIEVDISNVIVPIKKIYYTTYNNPKYRDQRFNIEIRPTEWTNYKQALIDDIKRTETIYNFIKNNTNNTDHAVVLLDRIEEVERYNNMFVNSRVLHGQLNKKERGQNVENIRNSPGILFGQIKATGTGLDIEKCNKVFIICSTKSKNTTIQAVGRATRLLKNKESYIYIFGDNAIKKHYREQLSHLRERYPRIPQIYI